MLDAALPQWLSSFIAPFVSLSYRTVPPAKPDSWPNASYYTTGPLDYCFIISTIAVMAILRDALRLGVYEPFARWYLSRRLTRSKAKAAAITNDKSNGDAQKSNGNAQKANGSAEKSNGNAQKSNGDAQKYNGAASGYGIAQPLPMTKVEARQMRHSVIRFAEQGWPAVYYIYQFAFGVYVHCNVPTEVLNPIDAWVDYPHVPLAGPLKFYYLTQCAFYAHQILILNAEVHRKDHWQMMTHHFITVTLMLMSYFYNCTRVGVLIMMLMDLPDVFLPVAKMLRYLSFLTLCDMTFVCFMVSWFITRHVLFVITIKSTYIDIPKLVPAVWDPANGYYMTKGVWITFLAMLITLELIQLGWFLTICRVAYRVVSGEGAEDTRSDSEEGFSEDEGKKKDR